LTDLLKNFDPKNPSFRPTEIYNEGWLLRVLLNEYSQHNRTNKLFPFHNDATWYSEAMLPTKFKARSKKVIGRKDKHAESRTNADGVIGHINVGKKGKADLELADNATQFIVIEAKMNSKLSKGISNSDDYDQAARTVACMIETIRLNENVKLSELDVLKFIVLAPHSKIEHDPEKKDKCDFWGLVCEKSIKKKVKARVGEYNGEKNFKKYDDWFNSCFNSALKKIDLEVISWENAIEQLPVGRIKRVREFYDKCLDFN